MPFKGKHLSKNGQVRILEVRAVNKLFNCLDSIFLLTAKERGSRSLIKRLKNNAAMAQEVEHILGKDEVTGSNPVSSST